MIRLSFTDNPFIWTKPTGQVQVLTPEFSFHGCDSFINVELSFWDEVIHTIDDQLCEGQSITVNGNVYDFGSQTGVDTLFNKNWRGCDSIVITNLTFGDGVVVTLDDLVCEGEVIIVNGEEYGCDNPTGEESFPGGSVAGCDSTVIIDLTCFQSALGSYTPTICSGDSLLFNGTFYHSGNDNGIENLGTIGFFPCDSIVEIQLSFYPPAFSTIDTMLCPGQVIPVGGEDVETSMVIVLEAGSFRGCDSTIYVTIDQLSTSSTLIDDVLCPGGTVVVDGVTYDENLTDGTQVMTNQAGCDSTITIMISFGDAVINNIDETICLGDSILIGGVWFNENNTPYTETDPGGSFAGCDSITNINISFFEEAINNYNPTICPEASLLIGGFTFDWDSPTGTVVLLGENYNGCDSTIHVSLEFWSVPTGSFSTTLCPGEELIINGTTYNNEFPSGEETIPMGSFNGCDTTFTVTIDFYPVAISNQIMTICEGDQLEMQGIILDFDNMMDTITLPGVTANGCDSLIIVELDFYPPATALIDNVLCFGQSLIVNGVEYNEITPQGIDTIDSYYGCDSIITIDLSFNSAITETNDPVFCDPTSESIVNENIYNIDLPSGIDTMTSSTGCDSIVFTDLTFLDSSIIFVNDVLCFGETMMVNGVEYSESMSQGQDVLPGGSPEGCDLYYDIDLSFHAYAAETIQETLCHEGDTIINGVLFNESHTTDTLLVTVPSFAGCDSFLIVNVDFYPDVIFNLTENLCEGQSVVVNGTIYDMDTPAGTEVISNSSVTGCDSTVIIELHFAAAITMEITETLCEGDSAEINGTIHHTDYTGSDTIIGGSYAGCDSILNISVNFIAPVSQEINSTLCFGQDTLINGQVYDMSGMYQDTLTGQSSTGCDSILLINLNILPMSSSEFDSVICAGEEFLFHGVIFNEDNLSGIINLVGESYSGCDSSIFVQVALNPLSEPGALNVSICEGESYEWNGQFYDTEGSFSDTLFGQSYTGCDSTSILFLEIQTAEDLGLAEAGADQIFCGKSLELAGNQPNGTTGTWSTIEGTATIENNQNAESSVDNLSVGDLLFVWTLSSDLCPDYDTDTLLLSSVPIPEANDDVYTTEIGSNQITINLVENDQLSDISDWYLNILNTPSGILQDLSDGAFKYTAEEDSLGTLISFNYELCNEDCPEICDTANVKIDLLDFLVDDVNIPNTITVNNDGINDVFIIPQLENDPELFDNNELIIFNRWADVVFKAEPYQNDWGGQNANGKELPQGTYYYLLRLDVGDGVIFKGDITILK